MVELDMPIPFRSDGASRCRYRAAPGGQNREDATTIGRPLSGHTPPTRHRQRTIPGQQPTPRDEDTSVRYVMSQTLTRDSTRPSSRQPQHPHSGTAGNARCKPLVHQSLTPADRYTA